MRVGGWRVAGLAAGLVLAAATAGAATAPPDSDAARAEAERLARMPPVAEAPSKPALDHSGRAEKGRASYYAKHFAHKKMADGRHMDPNSNVAASKSLPLGTTAKVVNTSNGKEAVVQVEDRGPFVRGRVVDVSPKVAKDLDLNKDGVAPVVVKPIAVPQPDGAVKLGAGAAESSPEQVRQATETTRQLAGTKEAAR
jgi:rare lipoprotein A